MNKEICNFLNDWKTELLKEAKLQNDEQPGIYVIQETDRIYYVEEDPDGYIIYDRTRSEDYQTTEEFLETMSEEFEPKDIYKALGIWKDIHLDGNLHSIETMLRILSGLLPQEDQKDFSERFQITPYKNILKINDQTFFFTLEDCKKHIKLNSYHYTDPKPCKITPWRSPRCEKLLDMIKNTDWDKECSNTDINTPMKVIQPKWDVSSCPNCHKEFSDYEDCNDGEYKRCESLKRCPYCGQRLSW